MKNRNWLIGTAVMTAAIVTVVPAQNSVEAAGASQIKQLIYSLNNENISISYEDFNLALSAEVLTNLNIKYITLSDNKYYSYDEFTQAFLAMDSLNAAIETLITGGYDIPLSNVSEGQIDVNSGSVTNKPSTENFSVLSIN